MTRAVSRAPSTRNPVAAGPRAAPAAACAALLGLAACGAAGPEGGVPPGVQMLLPRGGIPAIFDPRFVPATEAAMPDSAWVLALAIDGEARAYSLNLLNGHEVVNDVVGQRPIAAVW